MVVCVGCLSILVTNMAALGLFVDHARRSPLLLVSFSTRATKSSSALYTITSAPSNSLNFSRHFSSGVAKFSSWAEPMFVSTAMVGLMMSCKACISPF